MGGGDELMGERRVDGYTPLEEVSHSYRGWCAYNIQVIVHRSQVISVVSEDFITYRS